MRLRSGFDARDGINRTTTVPRRLSVPMYRMRSTGNGHSVNMLHVNRRQLLAVCDDVHGSPFGNHGLIMVVAGCDKHSRQNEGDFN